MENFNLNRVQYFKFFILFLLCYYKCNFNQIEDERINDCFQIEFNNCPLILVTQPFLIEKENINILYIS